MKKNNGFGEQYNEDDLRAYTASYSEEGLFDKMLSCVGSAGMELLYQAAKLFYVTQRNDVPIHTKVVLMGALGYLISPIDCIPDMVPVVGYTDDMAAIAFAVLQAQAYIDDDVRAKAKNLLRNFFGASAVSYLRD